MLLKKMKDFKSQIQESQKTLSKILKENLESNKRKKKRTKVRITAHLTSQTMQARRQWSDIIKVSK